MYRNLSCIYRKCLALKYRVSVKECCKISRGGNRTGRVGFGFRSDGSGRFDFLEEIGSGRIRSIYMLCFFISLIDFDWIKCHLISGWVESGQFDFLKKMGRVGFGFGSGLDPDGSDEFLGSGRVLPPLKISDTSFFNIM
jgi:hypothetical protein